MAVLSLLMLSLLASTAAVAAQAAGAPGDEPTAAQTAEASGDNTSSAQTVGASGDDTSGAPAPEVAIEDFDTLAAAGRWETLRSQADARLSLDASDTEALFWLGREQLEEAWGLLDGDRVARDIGRSVLDRAIQNLGAADQGSEPRAADWLLQARFSRWQLGSPGDGDLTTDTLADALELQWSQDARPMAAYLRGHMAMVQGGDGALQWFERAALAAPDRSAFSLDWSRELAAAGDRAGAVAAWQSARRGTDWALTDLLAALLVALPSTADADRRLELLDGLFAEPDLASDAMLAWHRAHALGLLDRREEAAAAFAAGSSGRTPAIDRAEASYLRVLGRLPEALELLFARARERHWDCLDDAVSIADSLAIAGDHSAALSAYETALSIEPRHELALWHRALSLWHGGQDEAAAAAWADLIERYPGRSDITNDGALAAWGVGDLPLAQERLEQAMSWPGSEDAQENLAVLLLESSPPDPQRALDLLEGVLQVDPRRDRSLLYRYRARRLAAVGGR